MKFSENELKEIYDYVADRLINEKLLTGVIPLLKGIEIEKSKTSTTENTFKGAFAPVEERPQPNKAQDAGGHIPESILNIGPGYGGNNHRPNEEKL